MTKDGEPSVTFCRQTLQSVNCVAVTDDDKYDDDFHSK